MTLKVGQRVRYKHDPGGATLTVYRVDTLNGRLVYFLEYPCGLQGSLPWYAWELIPVSKPRPLRQRHGRLMI